MGLSNIGVTAGGAQAAPPAVELLHVNLKYGARHIVEDFSCTVPQGKSLALMGASGSGKTSVLEMILGLVKPTSGTIRVEGVNVTKARNRDLLNLRRHRIGVVFQAGELLEDLAPVENVALAGMLAGQRRDDAYAEATNLLHALQVHSDVERSSDLSGGEQQRVAVALALMGDPALVVADEPTAALDQQTRRRVAEVVYALPKTHGVALIIATHDRDIAEQADAIISLSSESKATDPRQPC